MVEFMVGIPNNISKENEIGLRGVSLNRAEGLMLIMNTAKGRGVFASKDIAAKTILELSPVLVLDPVENEMYVRKTDLYHYTYNWPYPSPTVSNTGIKESTVFNATPKPRTTQAIILGLGSMFNHSSLHQNVGWERDEKNLLVKYTTLRDVKAGEELCISYGSRLTFKDADVEESMEIEDEAWVQKIDLSYYNN